MISEPKIAIYARKSKLTETGKSIDNQISKCKAYAFLKFDAGDNDIEIYHDDGKSGFYADRPEYLKMLKDIEKGKIKAVICYKFDRISRRTLDLLNLVERLKSKKITFVSCSDDIDTSSKTGKVLMSMLAIIAEFERDIIAERISDNLYELSKEGRWLGGVTPTGFYSKKESIMLHGRKSTVNHLEPIPEELIAVKKIYEIFLQKHSINETVRYTLKNNILTKNNKNHTEISIKNILSNPVYAIADEDIYNYYTEKGIVLYAEKENFNGINGLMVYNKTQQIKELKDDSVTLNPKYIHKNSAKKREDWVISVGKHKGIIQGRDWIAVQETLAENKSKYARPNKKTNALLGGLIVCPVCGKNMYAHKENRRFEQNGEPRFVYRCSSRKYDTTACTYKPLRGSVIDKFILDTLCKIGSKNSDEYYKALEDEIKLNSYNALRDEESELQKKIKRLKSELQSQIENLRIASGASKEFIMADINKLSNEIKVYENQLNQIQENKTSDTTTLKGLEKARELINSFENLIDTMTYEEKLELVRLVIAKVYVINKDNITDENGKNVPNDEVHIFLKGIPEENYEEFFKNINPIKRDLQQINENIKAQPQSKGVELLFCRNSDNALMTLIHIILPIKELSDNPTIGEKIKYYRFINNLTQEDLAKLLNISRTTIIKYENSELSVPLNVLNKAAELFNIPSDFLYDDYSSFLAYPCSKKIKEIRKKENLTQQKLADSLNVSKKTIKTWESGRGLISRENFQKLKKLYLNN